MRPGSTGIGHLRGPPPHWAVGSQGLLELMYLALDVTDQLAQLSQTGTGVEAGVDGVQRVVEGRSGGGRVTVRLRDGQPVEVRFDLRWLSDASPAGIAGHIRAAFDAAAAQAVDASTVVLAGRSFDELREVTADPEALVRRLGLAPHH